MLFIHSLSGRTFTTLPGESRFGAAASDGVWDDGTEGSIWTAETAFGAPVWTVLA